MTWHGTPGGYTNHHCRCAACRRAHRDAKRKSRDRTTPKGLPCAVPGCWRVASRAHEDGRCARHREPIA